MITPDQIRAARALAEWNQDDLARRCGLARATIVKIEKSQQMPEAVTIQKIISVFDEADIEFGRHEAVRRKNEDVKIYRGQENFTKFFENVADHAEKYGGKIFVSNVDERDWIKIQGDFFFSSYAARMTKIRGKHDFRILVRKGDEYMPASPYAAYRWVDEKDFSVIPFHVYGDNLSIFLFLDEPIIISLKNAEAADLYREKFLLQWKKAIKPSTRAVKSKRKKNRKK